jgi:type IV pilus assembly protein PilB
MENYQMMIFDSQDNQVKVGLVDPGNFLAHEAIDFLAKDNHWQVAYYAISLNDFRRLSRGSAGYTKELTSALELAEEKFAVREETVAATPAEQFSESVRSAPVAKIVSVIIRHAIEGKASDIHIEPGRAESMVRYRVDGILHTSLTLPSYLHSAVISRIKVMANLRLDETRIPQDGRIRLTLDGTDIDLRVSVLPMLNAEKVVIRVLDTSAGIPTLEQLGFSPYHIIMLKRNITRPFGIVLLTGPTGSGKTTTLYSILNIIRNEGVNITTLEDPIEYSIEGVNQSQINPEVGFTFAEGLRSVLRQDPNIVMVGEIRDRETTELVIHAGLTGHLVFSTLHTNNAWGAIPRMIDLKAEPFLLASTMNLVMAQRLVRSLCPDCRQEQTLPPALLGRIKEELAHIPKEFWEGSMPEIKFYHGVGCKTCGNSGYVGRTVISELFEVGQELKDIIAKEQFDSQTVSSQLAKQKFITLMQDGLVKALKAETTVDEVMRVTQL